MRKRETPLRGKGGSIGPRVIKSSSESSIHHSVFAEEQLVHAAKNFLDADGRGEKAVAGVTYARQPFAPTDVLNAKTAGAYGATNEEPVAETKGVDQLTPSVE